MAPLIGYSEEKVDTEVFAKMYQYIQFIALFQSTKNTSGIKIPTTLFPFSQSMITGQIID